MNRDIRKIISKMTLEEKASMCSGSDFWHTESIERLGIPRVMMCDGPHGLRKQKGEGDHLGINDSIKAVCFPTASALASSFDRDLLFSLGETLGNECQAEDVGMLLGPGLNMKRSPLCGRNFEYFSEDPYLAGQMAVSYIKGLQGKGVAACVKHFAANNQETRRMSGTSQIDERTLHEIYLPAFEAAVKEGKTRSVMCSYNAINGTYSAENKELLTDILREKWGYKGFVVTDWGGVKDRVKGLLAGLDLEMPGGAGVQDEKIVHAVQNGQLDIAVLDEAVHNILTFITDYQEAIKGGTFDIEKDHIFASKCASECAVLLKNENHILPISKEVNVAFIGEFADKPRFQGAGSSHINITHAESAVECSEQLNITYAQGYYEDFEMLDLSLIKEAVEAAKVADIAVIFAGLPDAFETEGADRETLDMPQNQNELISQVAAVQPNTVVVLHGGAPVVMPWKDEVKAILNMYLGGESVGRAVVDLLFGDANPSGKLAETYPVKLADNPSYLNFPGEDGVVEYNEGIFIGYRYYDKKQMDVLFPYGHGLSYTTFEYSDILINKNNIQDIDDLIVTCRVKNTGYCTGKEVVQLYVRDVESNVRRPIREMKGFEKVKLEPCEEKVITFTLSKRDFAYYEPKLHDWFVESGEFVIEIGASSRDIRLHAEVYVQGTVTLPIYYTRVATMGDLMRSEKGRVWIESVMYKQDQANHPDKSKNDEEEDMVKNLGKGSDKMLQNMIRDMPLSSLVTFGRITNEQLDELLTMVNEHDI